MFLSYHFTVCPRCASPDFVLAQNGRHFTCRAAGCDFEFFLNSAAAVGVILYAADGRILVLRRANEPGRGLLGLPGGFVDEGESAEATGCREVREESGLEIDPATLVYAGSAANSYPFRGVTYQTLDFFFSALHPGLEAATARHEVAEVLLLRPEVIDLDAFAFPTVRAAVGRFIAGRR